MRARVWTFILYPESLPDNYVELIEEKLIFPFVLSPVHDVDVADEGKGYEGTIYKKPHFHGMVMFTNVKSFKQVLTMLQEALGKQAVSNVAQVHSTQSMVRYFIHADHKKKAQYSKKDIRCFNGADLETLFEKNDREIYYLLGEIISFINDNQVEEIIDLLVYAKQQEADTWFPLITGKYSYIITKCIDSCRFKNESK